jgi:hypothetical protein
MYIIMLKFMIRTSKIAWKCCNAQWMMTEMPSVVVFIFNCHWKVIKKMLVLTSRVQNPDWMYWANHKILTWESESSLSDFNIMEYVKLAAPCLPELGGWATWWLRHASSLFLTLCVVILLSWNGNSQGLLANTHVNYTQIISTWH